MSHLHWQDLLAEEAADPLFTLVSYEDPRTGERRDLPEGLRALLESRELYTNMDWKGYGAFQDGRFDGEPTRDLGIADVAASQRFGSDTHAIMIDIDHPVRIIEESFGSRLEVIMDPGYPGKRRWATEVLPEAPAWIIPSSTGRHNHLYVDVDWPFKRIELMLRDYVEVGIVEPGYRDASVARGKTSLRLPWIAKPGTRPLPETQAVF